jgi:anaerobic selenocysteine-containing dehydrogenase
MWVGLSADDAARLGIDDGDLVKVSSPRGDLYAPARLSPTRAGVVFLPFHYGYWDIPNADGHHRAANEITLTAWDPVSKQPVFKSAAVAVSKAEARP